MKTARGSTDFASLLREALKKQASEQLTHLIDAHRPSEIADALEALPRELRPKIWQRLNASLRGAILTEVHAEVRQQLIELTAEDELLEALTTLQPDELADLDADLSSATVQALIDRLDSERRYRYEIVRPHPDNTAGGIMDIDATAIRTDMKIGEVLDYLRNLRMRVGKLPEHLESLMVIDEGYHYLGALRVSDVVSLDPEQRVAQAMTTAIPSIHVETPTTKVARLFENLDLISAPVVNDSNRLLGRITIDDVIDIVRREGEHNLMGQAGLDESADIFAPILLSAYRRTVWLTAHIINAFIVTLVIDLFKASIEQIVALAVLMPVVASMGGVAGNQTLTLVTRGIALDQIQRDNARHMIFRELLIGSLNGLFWALIVALVIYIWSGNRQLSLVFVLALMINLITAALAGVLVPLALQRQGIDPAIAGGVLLMAITDVVGFTAFLGLATAFLL